MTANSHGPKRRIRRDRQRRRLGLEHLEARQLLAGDTTVMFNDHVAGNGTHQNATLYAANRTRSGLLKDIETGEATEITLTVSALFVTYDLITLSPAEGTDAFEVFDGFVDMSVGPSAAIRVGSGALYTHTFSGLDPQATYDFVGTAVRGDANAVDKWTKVTLEGAEAFAVDHSQGIGVVTDGLPNNEVALWTGDNRQAGLVIGWTDIRSGSDGTFSVISEQYLGATPGVGTGSASGGAYGYALEAIRLTENAPNLKVISTTIDEGERLVAPPTSLTADFSSDLDVATVQASDLTVDGIPAIGVAVIDANTATWTLPASLAAGDHVVSIAEGAMLSTPLAIPIQAFELSFAILGAPTVENLLVSKVTPIDALIGGTVTNAGGDDPVLFVYWGDNDGGTDAAAWDHVISLGVSGNGQSRDTLIESLSQRTTYHYRAFAQNSVGSNWADRTISFTTPAAELPQIVTSAATSVAAKSARLNGNVISTGGDPPNVTLYYGPEDGGVNAAAWGFAIPLGKSGGEFSRFVTQLAAETTYYYRAFAQNMAGSVWSPTTTSFNTTADIPATVVINEIHYDPDDSMELVEFIELHNPSDFVVDLSEWTIVDAVDFTFPVGTSIPAGGCFTVAQNAAAFAAKFGIAADGQWQAGDRLNNDGEVVELRDAAGARIDRVDYQLGFPWPTTGVAGRSIELVNPFFDNDIGGNWRGGTPTPNAQNSMFNVNVAPQMRQVNHSPSRPTSGQDVTITVKVTDSDGVADVNLDYQIVDPGSYIRLSDADYDTSWTTVVMADDGTGGDEAAGDDIFTVILPGSLQTNRRLVRYRITAADRLAASVTVPYDDDPQPNFAYFVYDGIPAWTGADRPGVTDAVTYGTEVTNSLPAFHLISREMDVLNSQYNTAFNTNQFRFEGTLVVGDEIYDHIRYRIRGQNSTYVSGKNKWKVQFNRGHYFQGHDQYSDPWPEKLQTLNFGTNASPWAPGNRGLAGMDEALAFKLFARVGVPAANVTPFQLRVIDSVEEASATDQYQGDLWGLYLAFENPEKQFLNAHDLPDGNLFRMQAGGTQLESQGFGLPGDRSDVNAFTSTAGYNRNPSQPVQWWRDNVDLEGYYSFRSVMEAINHNDIRDRENMLLFFNPETAKWSMLPWDVDLLYEEFDRWGPDGVQNASPIENFRRSLVHEEINIEFQNRSRELQDLLLNDDQGWAFIEEYARYVEPFAAIDRALWDYNPRASSSPANGQHRGAFYNEVYSYPAGNGAAGQVRRAISPVGFEGMVNWVKEFISLDGFGGGQLAVLNADPDIPSTPALTFAGQAAFPADDLRFVTGPFVDPQGSDTFAAIEWRLGEVSDPEAPSFDDNSPRDYEIDAVWQSGPLTEFVNQMMIPGNVVEPGHAYRARVRMQDSSGRWSHWSDPVQFVATAPGTSDVQRYLRITELNYNPDGRGSVGSEDGSEFIELTNVSSGADAITLDLGGTAITRGPSQPFVFAAGTFLAPGEYLLVVKNQADFAANYPTNTTSIAGEFAGSLANGGELVQIEDANGGLVMGVEYQDSGLWPARADGAGATLELIGPTAVPPEQLGKYYSWRGSTRPGGTPGEPGSAPIGVLINEVLANTDGVHSVDAIELFNATDEPIVIGGWYLSDSVDDLLKFQIPLGTTLGSGEYVVFDENDFNPTPETPGPKDFALSGAGDDVWLVVPDGQGGVASFVDDLHFGASVNGRTIGRLKPDIGQLMTTARPTLGCENSHARVSSIVVSEIQLAPDLPSAEALAIEPDLDGNDLEFLELASDSVGPVDLGGWRIRGGVDLDIAAGTVIQGVLVVVSFDPTDPLNTNKVAAFRAHYGLSSAVPLIGGYAGSLENRGEQIRLERPDAPPAADPAVVPFVAVDTITYDDVAPWPIAVIGTGASLHRTSPAFYGNDGSLWLAAAASPGTVDFSVVPMGDFNGDRLVTAHDVDSLLDALNDGLQWSTYDLDGDGQAGQGDVGVLLASIGALPGDANLDGVVNAVDLNRVGIHWQQTDCTNWSSGDFNGDGAVTAQDLNTLGVHWLQTAAPPNATLPVARPPRAPLAVMVEFAGKNVLRPEQVDEALATEVLRVTESLDSAPPVGNFDGRHARPVWRQSLQSRRSQAEIQDDAFERMVKDDEVLAMLAW